MPQRFLRPGLTNSEHWNQVSFAAQSLFVRLLTLVDDYGRYDARPALVRSHAFPVSDIEKAEVETMLDELEREEMLTIYEVDGKEYLQLTRWQERARGASKYPPLPGSGDECQPRGTIYFIQGATSLKVKIGYTHWKVESRMSVLQTGATEKLRLIGSMPGTKAEERALHRAFTAQNVGGEWFTPSAELSACAQDAAIARKYLLPSPSPLVLAFATKPSVIKSIAIAPTHAPAWSAQDGWQNVTDDLKDRWRIAYPACDINRQLYAMQEWLMANPTKARKSNWPKFITNWLTREQDKGGDTRSKTPTHQRPAANHEKGF